MGSSNQQPLLTSLSGMKKSFTTIAIEWYFGTVSQINRVSLSNDTEGTFLELHYSMAALTLEEHL